TRHKTAWRGRVRVIALGPKAQAVVRPFLALDTQAHLFSPARALAERAAGRRARRKTRVQPSQQSRRKANPRRRRRDFYTNLSYLPGIRGACRRAGVPHWPPNQLRHTFATVVRRQHGLEAAQVLLGHAHASTTEIYAEADTALAARVAAEVG